MRGFAASFAQSPLFAYAFGSTISLAKADEFDADRALSTSATAKLVETKTPEETRAATSVPRTKTTYHIAHPAPVAHKRPKLLLQLQDGSTGSRPTPAFNVIPARLLAPRIGRRIPKVVKGTTGLTENDLVVFRAEDYETNQDETCRRFSSIAEKDPWLSGDPFGVISDITSSTPKGVLTEISLNDGTVWHGKRLRNGNYEFVCILNDEKDKCVRWIARKSSRKGSTTKPEGVVDSKGSGSRFTFSFIDPQARKHPIIATLDHNTQTLEICDWYNAPWAFSERALSVPMPTSEHLRSLIILTGTWVALREGWSSCFIFDSQADLSQLTPPIQGIGQIPPQSSSQLSVVVSQPYNSVSGRTPSSAAASSSFASQSSGFKNIFGRRGSKVNPESIDGSGPNSRVPSMSAHARAGSTGSIFLKQHSSPKVQPSVLPLNVPILDSAYASDDSASDNSSLRGSPHRHQKRTDVLRASLSKQHAIAGRTRVGLVSEQQWGNPVKDLGGNEGSNQQNNKGVHTKPFAQRMVYKFRVWRTKISKRVRRKR